MAASRHWTVRLLRQLLAILITMGRRIAISIGMLTVIAGELAEWLAGRTRVAWQEERWGVHMSVMTERLLLMLLMLMRRTAHRTMMTMNKRMAMTRMLVAGWARTVRQKSARLVLRSGMWSAERLRIQVRQLVQIHVV
ncbi:hypothetical protein CAOG_07013 [Capsaspora owczarzaki ATCC 30864]|uniref:hypothetical protein n=1 Tax=Capsaspora owczarzaki (strain ATCC 30864) TaxID=595528 RepID=UPI0001FE4625|nr:hypothetical protein CAOG_07013 [Capsaspora owczarzaki ATCC 30864]|eukprot:XP_004343737.1 hypothetical protein CAOG_07013 [Capsaspora owczarzaki ATCC 30864]